MSKKKIYWLCQILGWSLWALVQIVLYSTTQGDSSTQFFGEILLIILHIGLTHCIRYSLIHFGWLNLSLLSLILRTLGLIVILAIANDLFALTYRWAVSDVRTQHFALLLVDFLIPFVLYVFWTILYLSVHYFENYNKSLKYEAAVREIELNNLRSQLNPHFIFNALNSIRALVDENPKKSKNAITQLSNILRNSLMVDRKRLIHFSEELRTIQDYLALESIRYEERLKTKFDIDPASQDYLIPPLMVQTLVENGIKHGVAELKDGGEISLITNIRDNFLSVEIRNTGQILEKKQKSVSGFGLSNTKKRLELIYGDEASFSIKNENKHTVLTEILIPRSL
ncbi:MAG: histidine kinase [Cyclobacteriaceae bacterium]